MEHTQEERNRLITSFIDIVGSQSDRSTAAEYLRATSWSVGDAIQLYYAANLTPRHDVRSILSEKTDIIYDHHEFSDYFEQSMRPSVWGSDQRPSSSTSGNSGKTQQPSSSASNSGSTQQPSSSSLASLYNPPFEMMYSGPFYMAKADAAVQDKWLILNLQSDQVFSSHLLNRDTWSNEIVKQAISSNFIFWQVQCDSREGLKVSTYYKLDSFPAILIIDPVTGEKMYSWCGMVQPEALMEHLLPFIDRGPKAQYSLSRKQPTESFAPMDTTLDEEEVDEKEIADEVDEKEVAAAAFEDTSSNGISRYPPLPKEPEGGRELVCTVAIRLSDGRRVQRNFLRADTVKLLWSFCATLLEEGETRYFHFMQAIPTASKKLEYESNLNFEEAGVANSVVSLSWD